VGDQVAVGGETPNVTGIVEEVSLRITRLRGEDGTVWFVPNGDIRKVGNRSRGT
jgi:moderate conductance mechanosensitive channel